MNENYFQGECYAKLEKYAWQIAHKWNPPKSLSREDFVQDMLAYVWAKRGEWNEDRGASFFTWAYWCMRYAAINSKRKVTGDKDSPRWNTYHRTQYVEDYDLTGTKGSGGDTSHAEMAETMFGMEEDDYTDLDYQIRLRSSTPRQRQVIFLLRHGFNFAEIGRILHIRNGTAADIAKRAAWNMKVEGSKPVAAC